MDQGYVKGRFTHYIDKQLLGRIKSPVKLDNLMDFPLTKTVFVTS